MRKGVSVMDFERVLNLGVEKEIINETQKNSLIDLFYKPKMSQNRFRL